MKCRRMRQGWRGVLSQGEGLNKHKNTTLEVAGKASGQGGFRALGWHTEQDRLRVLGYVQGTVHRGAVGVKSKSP